MASGDRVLVLIGMPGSSNVGTDVSDILNNYRASQPRWLAEGIALEVDEFEEIETAAREIRKLEIDAVVVSKDRRRKKVLLADMDSTMIEQECIDELGVVAGVGDHIKQVTAKAMRGELDFEGALKERVALLKGLPQQAIQDVIERRITLMPGGKTLLATMKAHGAYTALVSGGFTSFTGHVARVMGFDESRANTLIVKDGKLTGEVAMPILGKDAKVESLHRICAERGVAAEDVLAVGDGANDIPMLQAAGMGVALHAKPKVQEQARFVINHGDLTALLYLQGYSKSDFVTA